ncbi:carbamoyltransferase HypF [bacterium]|nr:carbamoyltransferase HypF [bacterium]
MNKTCRWRFQIRGAVQGVGFRPFVFRLAEEIGLRGWVVNSPRGVTLEIEGPGDSLKNFRHRLSAELPPNARITGLEVTELDPIGFDDFEIRESDHSGAKTAIVLADIATCELCRTEILDPANRRYRYPFTNCTHCGPRFSIIAALPYDRANTSMSSFTMCPECQREYTDPRDRRFHAQPNACPVCGPSLALWDKDGNQLASKDDALRPAEEALASGRIVAVKGLGGFHLMCDATNDRAIQELRTRKRRSEKPFAVMFPSIDAIRASCDLHDEEARALQSPEAPIVLLDRFDGPSREIAPGNPTIGAMLPYTPLHILLMNDLSIPLVATSANISEEPICTDEREAIQRLQGVADFFLVHNRPILRPVEDSVVRIAAGREVVLRRSRGYSPLPVRAPIDCSHIMALGGHLKNTIALGIGEEIMTGPHGGDLENVVSFGAFKQCVEDFQQLYEVPTSQMAIDRHPDYMASRFGRETDSVPEEIQHHFAHVAACMAENELTGRVLGVSWDGTGYGLDGTIWGGEFLLADEADFERVAHLRPFRLPGGEKAVREPRRCALGLLYEALGDAAFDEEILRQQFEEAEWKLLVQALPRGLNAPITTSAGRLFDAAASLAGIRQVSTFEGQAAMELEFAARAFGTASPYEMDGPDWAPMAKAILSDRRAGVSAAEIAARFHQTLVEVIAGVAKMAGEERVILTGGCFQNRVLLEGAIGRLRRDGFTPYWHQRVPPNDGGLAVGQVYAAAARRKRRDGDVSRSSGKST